MSKSIAVVLIFLALGIWKYTDDLHKQIVGLQLDLDYAYQDVSNLKKQKDEVTDCLDDYAKRHKELRDTIDTVKEDLSYGGELNYSDAEYQLESINTSEPVCGYSLK